MNEWTQMEGNILITMLLRGKAGGQGSLILVPGLRLLFHAVSQTPGLQGTLSALGASVPDAALGQQPLSWAQA